MLSTMMVYLKRCCLDYTLRQMLGKLMMNGIHMEVVITSRGTVPDVPGRPWASTKTPIRPAVTVATATGNLPSTRQNRLTQLVRVNNLIIVVVNTAEQAKLTSSETPHPWFCECVCDQRPPPSPSWQVSKMAAELTTRSLPLFSRTARPTREIINIFRYD